MQRGKRTARDLPLSLCLFLSVMQFQSTRSHSPSTSCHSRSPYHSRPSCDYTSFCKLRSGLRDSCTVEGSLRIFGDFTWMFFYCGRQVEPSRTALLADIPASLNTGVCMCVCVSTHTPIPVNCVVYNVYL